MPDLWHPRAVRNPASPNLWGTYTGGPFKGVLHTTETTWYRPTGPGPSNVYDGYGHNYFPHATIVLEGSRGVIYQHIPVNRAARALVNAAGGVQTNNDGAVQCEIAWRAAQAPQMPKALLDAVADWMRWVEAVTGVKRKAAHFAYGVNVRMSGAEWDRFDGWCGHQHVPENSHTDPGAIDIAYLLSGDTPPAPVPATPDDGVVIEEGEDMQINIPAGQRRGLLLSEKSAGDVILASVEGGHPNPPETGHLWIEDDDAKVLSEAQIVFDSVRKVGHHAPKNAAIAIFENQGHQAVVMAYVPSG